MAMQLQKRLSLLATLGLLFTSPLSATESQDAALTQAAVFEKIKKLEGYYLEDEVPENAAKVTYELWSRDTAVMEIWQMPTKREFTVFHMDGDKLVATHYCGNRIQVTMDLVWPAQNDTYEFKARYVSNHAGPDAPYNSGFSYRFLEDGNIWRNEAWTTAGKTNEGALTLVKQAVDDS